MSAPDNTPPPPPTDASVPEAEAAPAPPPEPVKPGISRIAIALFAAWIGLGAGLVVAPEAAGILTFLFVLAGWMLSICIHEFGHAFAAMKGGDTTVAAKGYLRLDPRKYVDLGTSLVIPIIALALGGIGFPGGAVYIREDLIRSRRMRALASLAGPLGTFVVLITLVGATGVLIRTVPQPSPLFPAMSFLIFLQATALVLNLLPLPGLDGYGVIRPFLPEGVRKALRPVERVSLLLLLALVFLVPYGSAVIFAPAAMITEGFGVPIRVALRGWDIFTFWDGPDR